MKKKIILIVLTIFVIFLLIGLSLFFYNKNNSKVIISINEEEIVLDINDTNNIIDLETLNTEDELIIKKKTGLFITKVNGKNISFINELNLGKIEISTEEKINILIKDFFGNEKTFIINTLPSTFPKYTVEGKSEYDGDYYMSTYSFDYDDIHYIFKLDNNGKMKYYKRTNMVAFDFKKEFNSNNEVRYMYLEATADNWDEVTSLLPCDLVVMNEKYEEIDRIKYLSENNTYTSLENHSYVYLDDNHYILTSYEVEEKIKEKEKIKLFHNKIQEFKDGKILWEFNSKDYPELNKNSSVGAPDYIHINSIDIDKDDSNLICSFRNIDSILKISRKDGKILWNLGGIADEFGLTKEQKFSKQHSAISIGNNTILLYDNGNSNTRSRILKIILDEKNKKIKEYIEYDTGLYAYMMGSVRVIDEPTETYLICYGGGVYKKFSVEEIKYSTNEVKFKFTFNTTRAMYNANKI